MEEQDHHNKHTLGQRFLVRGYIRGPIDRRPRWFRVESRRRGCSILCLQSSGPASPDTHGPPLLASFPSSVAAAVPLQRRTDQLGIGLGAERLGPLNRRAQSPVDDDLRQHADGPRHAKEHSVVAGLGEAVVLQEDTGMLSRVSCIHGKIVRALTASTLG